MVGDKAVRHRNFILSALLAAVSVFFAVLSLHPGTQKSQEQIFEEAMAVAAASERSDDASPDFGRLRKVNPDIYAWLYFPAAGVNCPVLQSREDDAYYLTHNSAGSKDACGAVFSQAEYNEKNFDGPLTVLYGNLNGAFRNLQTAYTDHESLRQGNLLRIYLPEQRIDYTVFAAVPYSNRHLLYIRDFEYRITREELLSDVFRSRAINSYLDREADVSAEDRLLVLSTALQGNPEKRYLILAKKD